MKMTSAKSLFFIQYSVISRLISTSFPTQANPNDSREAEQTMTVNLLEFIYFKIGFNKVSLIHESRHYNNGHQYFIIRYDQ